MKTKQKLTTSPLKKLSALEERKFLSTYILDSFETPPAFGATEIFTRVSPRKLGLTADHFRSLAIVTFDGTGPARDLLLTAPTGRKCGLIPRGSFDGQMKALGGRDLEKILTVVDGWLVVTTAGGCCPQLFFSVIPKRNWIAAGRPSEVVVDFRDK